MRIGIGIDEKLFRNRNRNRIAYEKKMRIGIGIAPNPKWEHCLRVIF